MQYRNWTPEQVGITKDMLLAGTYTWSDISLKTGKTIGSLMNFSKRHIPDVSYQLHRFGQKQMNLKLTEAQEQLILGSTLGDMYIAPVNSGSARLQTSHGILQKDYVDHKYEILSNVTRTPPKSIINMGYGDILYRFNTISHSVFCQYRELCYIENIKTVTREWLNKINSLGLAYFYMDDGSCSRNVIKINTHGFTIENNLLIIQWLKDKWNVEADLNRDSKNRGYGFYIIIKGDSRFLFNKIVSPHIIESMGYKKLTVEQSYDVSCYGCHKIIKVTPQVHNSTIASQKVFLCRDPECIIKRKRQVYENRKNNKN